MRVSQLEILPKMEKDKKEKKARILTLTLFSLTIIPSLIFWLFANFREGKIYLPKISLSFDLPVITNKKTNKLSAKLSTWAAANLYSLPGQWSVRVDFLESDFSWGVNDKDQFTAASLMKLPIVAAFYYQVETGKLGLGQIYTLKKSDKVGGAGSLQYRKPGEKLTLEELATLSLSRSDNTAAGILRKLVGDELIMRLILKWGMTRTDLKKNLISAEDTARFFRLLYKGDILSAEFKKKFLADLTITAFEDRIPTGVPEGIRVAHKIGSEVGVVSDAGIIFIPDKPFVLVILSQGTNEAIAKERFPQLVNKIYWLVAEE